MLQAQTRACIRRNAALRSYSTINTAKKSSTTGISRTSNDDAKPLSHYSIIIQPNILSSMADVYAVIRSIEVKYGKIQEFRPMRDVCIPSVYQPRIYAVFENKESAAQIPQNGAKVVVKDPPPTYEDVPGGPGLADFKHLLTPTAPVPSTSTTNVDEEKKQHSSWESVLEKSNAPAQTDAQTNEGGHKRRLTATIIRSVTEFHTRGKWSVKNRMASTEEDNFGRKFLAFSGFAPLKPISPEEGGAMRDEVDDTYWMRRVTSKWAAKTGLLDPGLQVSPPSSSSQEKGGEGRETTDLGSVLEEIIHPPSLETKPADSSSAAPAPPTPKTSPPTPTIALTPVAQPKSTPKLQKDGSGLGNTAAKSNKKARSQVRAEGPAKPSTSESKMEKGDEQAKGAAEGREVKSDDKVTDRLKKMLGGWL